MPPALPTHAYWTRCPTCTGLESAFLDHPQDLRRRGQMAREIEASLLAGCYLERHPVDDPPPPFCHCELAPTL